MRYLRFFLLVLGIMPVVASAQQNPRETGVPVSMVVTAELRRGGDVPMLDEKDVMVYLNHQRAKVTNWEQLQGQQAGVEVFLLIDDNSSDALGTQLGDLREFINGLPATTAIGVAYMQNGTAVIAQDLTKDHALAAKALRLPLGDVGASASPYFSLGDLIKRWPQSKGPREVLMVTDGIDRYWGNSPDDPYVDSVVDQSQKAGVVVFSIYMPGVGHYGHSHWGAYWGQIFLSQVSESTGGESYFLWYSAPVAFRPYLQDFTNKLQHQFILTFLAPAEKKAGFQQVKVQTEVPNVDLVSADKVYVPAGQ